MPPFIGMTEVFGQYILVVDAGWAVFLAFAFLALAIAVPYVANIPQPTPRWTQK